MSLPFCVHTSPRSDFRLRALLYAEQETGHREQPIIDGSPGQNNAKQGSVQIDAFYDSMQTRHSRSYRIVLE